MFNPIQDKRNFVKAQIEKSFNGGIEIAEEMDLQKAHKDGDHHPTKPWVWVSSANGGKGDWRVEGGRAHQKAGATAAQPKPRRAGATSEIERMDTHAVHNAILGLNNTGTNVKDKGDHFLIEFDHNDFTTNGKRSPQIDRIAKFLESMGASCVIGNNNIKAYKHVKAEPKKTATAQKYSEMELKDAKKALMGKVVTIKDYWPNGRGTGMSDAVGKITNVRLYGKDKTAVATLTYPTGDTEDVRLSDIDRGKITGIYGNEISLSDSSDIYTERKVLNLLQVSSNKYTDISKVKATKTLKGNWSMSYDGKDTGIVIGGNELSESELKKLGVVEGQKKSDPRDKAAQAAGFKDYDEMQGYQSYVTKKQLLKKPSMQARTKAEDRKQFEAEVAQYEKEHADVIAKIAKRNKSSKIIEKLQ